MGIHCDEIKDSMLYIPDGTVKSKGKSLLFLLRTLFALTNYFSLFNSLVC